MTLRTFRPNGWLAALLLAAALLFVPESAALAQAAGEPPSAEGLTLDQRINNAVQPATAAISSVIFFTVPVAGQDIPFVLPDERVAASPLLQRLLDDPRGLVRRDSLGAVHFHPDCRNAADLDRLAVGLPAEERAELAAHWEAVFQHDAQDIPFVLIWLIVGAVFFTLRFRFVNVRQFKLAVDVVRGKYDDPNEPGEVSHFQALTAALSGTVGLGNIAGVAIAISLGGPGATFWMILAGLFGMSTKFVECTLGVKFRTIDPDDGEVHGGPMYYLSRGIKERFGGSAFGTVLGSVLAFLAAVMIIGGSFGGGNMFQINQAATQFTSVTGLFEDQTWIVGLVMAVLVGVVILGGIRSIANVTDKIVPVMVGVYVVAALFVIFGNLGHVGEAFGAIFSGAFSAEAVYGGFIGVLIQGFKRAAFSNEAGVGSASIAHSAVKTDQPASEGIVALLEPFIDTVVVCTMTALVIVITGEYQNFAGDTSTAAGVSLTSAAFESVISWFPYVLMAAVVLFAFSTMITWSYYGMQATKYLFGDRKPVEYGYKLVFCLLVIAGSTMDLGAVTDFSDAMILGMAFPNILGLYLLFPFVEQELNRYLESLKHRG